jgi:diadenosine tetraphosphate (Ap4A) HIT family hydrolase
MTWKNPKEWEDMKQGKNCPMCADIHLDVNPHSFMIAEFKNSYVRLPRNQYWRGWVLVALKRHANELYELSSSELHEFWDEVSIAAKAVNTVFKPVKINYAIFGNLCPHVHCHLFPQKFENDPHAPIKQDAEEVLLTGEEYESIKERLRAAITSHQK